MLPEAVAVRVSVSIVPPRFKVELANWISPPVPVKAVVAVMVPLFDSTPGEVTVSGETGTVNVPSFS